MHSKVFNLIYLKSNLFVKPINNNMNEFQTLLKYNTNNNHFLIFIIHRLPHSSIRILSLAYSILQSQIIYY